MDEVRAAILSGEPGALASVPVPESYRGVVVRADEVRMFEGLATRGQGSAAKPARGGGADPGSRARRSHRRGDGQRHQLQHGVDVDLRARADLRVPCAGTRRPRS